MDTFNSSSNIVTFILIGIGVFVFWSGVTLFRYFFGGRNPLEWNTIARVEAAQNPANLMSAYNDYQSRRFLLTFFGILFAVGSLVLFAPDQAAIILAALRDALGIIFGRLVESARVFLEQYRAQQ